MSASDSRGGTSSRQDRTILPPAVQPVGVYTRRQIQRNLNMTDKTFAAWITQGLKPIPNTGTGVTLFFAEDVYKFLKSLQSPGE